MLQIRSPGTQHVDYEAQRTGMTQSPAGTHGGRWLLGRTPGVSGSRVRSRAGSGRRRRSGGQAGQQSQRAFSGTGRLRKRRRWDQWADPCMGTRSGGSVQSGRTHLGTRQCGVQGRASGSPPSGAQTEEGRATAVALSMPAARAEVDGADHRAPS